MDDFRVPLNSACNICSTWNLSDFTSIENKIVQLGCAGHMMLVLSSFFQNAATVDVKHCESP